VVIRRAVGNSSAPIGLRFRVRICRGRAAHHVAGSGGKSGAFSLRQKHILKHQALLGSQPLRKKKGIT
jgi:hypothetical protein